MNKKTTLHYKKEILQLHIHVHVILFILIWTTKKKSYDVA